MIAMTCFRVESPYEGSRYYQARLISNVRMGAILITDRNRWASFGWFYGVGAGGFSDIPKGRDYD